MDLSYAQNLEDYHLAQAFAGQTDGFYIDVGAGHPVADNVSCWFYLQGWRGIVVEPQENLAALYGRIRPRDIVACAALGDHEGSVAFHEVERLHGFSTIDASIAEGARAFGAGFRTRHVPMTTLAALCAKHDVSRIDFLKIDVEGAEGAVLHGNEWARFRPRVVLLEALAPGSLAEAHQAWEPFLLDQGYEFVLFEGLNRFYVAKEDQALLQRFPRERAEWLVVPHLGHTNRAPFRDDHPDHVFAKDLVGHVLGLLPKLDPALLETFVLDGLSESDLAKPPSAEDRARVIARLFPGERFAEASRGLAGLEAPTLREFYRRVMAHDAFRILLGRLSMSYDGGQILD